MRTWVVLLIVGAALAGCAEDGGPKDTGDVTGLDSELEATEDTGIIRGVVVDPAIVPIAGVTITIQGSGASTQTNEAGEFGFDGLSPGTYFLTATKLGYFDVQQSTDVVAGEARPPIVRVLMERDAGFNPYSSTQQYTGFYQCGTSAVVVCGAPGILLGIFGMEDPVGGDTSNPYLYFEEGVDFIQAEMVWESSQALSPELYFEMEALDSNCDKESSRTFLANAQGESPIRARANETVLDEGGIGGPNCGIYFSVFSGGAQGTPAGASFQQGFDWFITEFHGYTPPEDWWYIIDGPLAPPS